MDRSREIADFLRAPRAWISPESAGLPADGRTAVSRFCAARKPPGWRV
ncbi:hypothetical protein [Streptomyces sp. NPDC101237]